MTFHSNLLTSEPFVPHTFDQIDGVYPPGAMPEVAYLQYVDNEVQEDWEDIPAFEKVGLTTKSHIKDDKEAVAEIQQVLDAFS